MDGPFSPVATPLRSQVRSGTSTSCADEATPGRRRGARAPMVRTPPPARTPSGGSRAHHGRSSPVAAAARRPAPPRRAPRPESFIAPPRSAIASFRAAARWISRLLATRWSLPSTRQSPPPASWCLPQRRERPQTRSAGGWLPRARAGANRRFGLPTTCRRHTRSAWLRTCSRASLGRPRF